MNCEKVKITPTTAREWLQLVPGYQRRVSEAAVEKIAFAISRDEWRENAATIVFNNKNELIDGQHRLHAIVKAGRTVWSLVARGVSSNDDTFSSIDDSVARNAANFLHCVNATAVSAVGNILWHVINDDFPSMDKKPPITDHLRTIKPYAEILSTSIIYQCSKAGKITGNGSFLAFLVLYYKHVKQVPNADRIDEFMLRTADGVGLASGSPMLALRNRFAMKHTNERIKVRTARALIIKALHSHMDGRQINRLSIDLEKEKFPELR